MWIVTRQLHLGWWVGENGTLSPTILAQERDCTRRQFTHPPTPLAQGWVKDWDCCAYECFPPNQQAFDIPCSNFLVWNTGRLRFCAWLVRSGYFSLESEPIGMFKCPSTVQCPGKEKPLQLNVVAVVVDHFDSKLVHWQVGHPTLAVEAAKEFPVANALLTPTGLVRNVQGAVRGLWLAGSCAWFWSS